MPKVTEKMSVHDVVFHLKSDKKPGKKVLADAAEYLLTLEPLNKSISEHVELLARAMDKVSELEGTTKGGYAGMLIRKLEATENMLTGMKCSILSFCETCAGKCQECDLDRALRKVGAR